MDNSPSAFPIPNDDRPGAYEASPGMSLRDWFAGQALAGLMANASMPFAPDYAECEPQQIAESSYDIADAMLAARQKTEQ